MSNKIVNKKIENKDGNVEMVKENTMREMENDNMKLNLDRVAECVRETIKDYKKKEWNNNGRKNYELCILEHIRECHEGHPTAIKFGLSEEDAKYCGKVLDFMVLSNSVDFIGELYNAEGEELIYVYDKTKDIYEGSNNKIYKTLSEERNALRKEITRDYIFHSLPAAKELLDKFMEWFKTEINYSYMMSDYIDMLDCGGWSDIMSYVGNYVTGIAREETKITDFTDYEEDSVMGDLWNKLCWLIDGDFLWEEYDEILMSFREEFIEQYK